MEDIICSNGGRLSYDGICRSSTCLGIGKSNTCAAICLARKYYGDDVDSLEGVPKARSMAFGLLMEELSRCPSSSMSMRYAVGVEHEGATGTGTCFFTLA